MAASAIALVILTPFATVFAYATWHEYRRYKDEGPSSYGLTYDPETNTTTVGPIPKGEESFDPADFEPDLPEIQEAEEAEADIAEGEGETDAAPDTDRADADHDDSNKDRQT